MIFEKISDGKNSQINILNTFFMYINGDKMKYEREKMKKKLIKMSDEIIEARRKFYAQEQEADKMLDELYEVLFERWEYERWEDW